MTPPNKFVYTFVIIFHACSLIIGGSSLIHSSTTAAGGRQWGGQWCREVKQLAPYLCLPPNNSVPCLTPHAASGSYFPHHYLLLLLPDSVPPSLSLQSLLLLSCFTPPHSNSSPCPSLCFLLPPTLFLLCASRLCPWFSLGH